MDLGILDRVPLRERSNAGSKVSFLEFWCVDLLMTFAVEEEPAFVYDFERRAAKRTRASVP